MKEKRRTVWPLVISLILMGAVTGASAQQTDRKSDSISKDEGIAGGFCLSATIDKHQFVSGEPILLKVSLSNATDHTLHILGTILQLDYEVDVRNESGERVSLTEEGKRAERTRRIDISLGRIFLDAGESRQETIQVNRLYDMVGVGKYSIVVRRGVPGRVIGQPVVSSNTVTLSVTAAAEQSI
jgi:hypothetical protein